MRFLPLIVLLCISANATEDKPVFDAFGGYSAIQSEGRIFFYTEKIDGRWWLVNPAGNAFFSKGVNGVLFAGPKSQPLGEKIFYETNLDIYETQKPWSASTAERLKGWHVNTIGARSSAILHKQKMPYVLNLNVSKTLLQRAPNQVPDVFSDDFHRAVRRAVRVNCEPAQNDLFLVGYFLDDHLDWLTPKTGDLSLLEHYLQLKAEEGGRIEATRFLRLKYHNIADLNQAWQTGATSFETINKSMPLPETNALQQDREEFFAHAARHYFETCHNEINEKDPNHLILGVRFASLPPTAILNAMKKPVDVVSIDTTHNRISIDQIKAFHQATQKPVLLCGYTGRLISEDNSSNNILPLSRVLQLPFIVGYHWDSYYVNPQAVDGIAHGLVTPKNEDYQEWVKPLRYLNSQAERIHSGETRQITAAP